MATFRNTNIPFNGFNCDTIVYNKSKHDLFSYTSDPTFSSIAFPGQSGGVWPIALNPSCYLNDAPYKVNCSGVSLRRKNYGGYDTAPYQGLTASSSGCFGTLPSSVNSTQEARLRNIAYWNNSQYNVVLISPRHAISTKHWLPTPGPETASFSFLLSDNTILWKNFVRVRASPGVDLLQGLGSTDLVVWRISDAQDLSNEINSNLLKCYPEYFDFEDAATISYLTSTFNTSDSIRPIGFRIDGNDRVIRGVVSVNNTGTVGEASFEVLPSDAYGNINTLDQYQPIDTPIHAGDSGSPQFVYNVIARKTLYIGSAAGHGISHANSTVKVNAINAELQANGGYSLTKIDVNNLKLMSLSDWSNVNVNHNNGLKNIAEIYGNFVVKNTASSAIPVKQLWAKTGAADTTPTLIWDTTTTPPNTTDIPTEPPADTCGVCVNEPVYYPYMPKIAERWNCNLWNLTGTFNAIKYNAPFNTGEPTPQVVNPYGSDLQNGGYTVYRKLPAAIQLIPPPPGYCMGEFTSYSVKDRVAVILRRPMEQWTFAYTDPTDQQSFSITDYYALKKPTTLEDPFNDICFESCGGDPCIQSGPLPTSAGGSGGVPCNTTIGDVVSGTTGVIKPQNIVFDTGCISTRGAYDSRCISACYGKPSNFINAPHTFDCKFVSGILPHLKTSSVDDPSGLLGIRVPEFSGANYYPENKFAYTYSDFMFILESGCETGENSAWLFRYFLPIYVTLPNYNHPILGSNFNYKGKYIEVTRQNTTGFTTEDPVNTVIDQILNGEIKASTVMISEDVDVRGNPVINWNLIGFPKPTHTHVMMLEILTPTPAACNVCINAGGKDGLAQTRIDIIRFYPLTSINGITETYFSAYVNENIQIGSNFYGANTVDDAFTFYPSSFDSMYNFYTDTYGKNGIVPDSRRIEGITYPRFYNSYKQSPIDSGSAIDCNCNPIL